MDKVFTIYIYLRINITGLYTTIDHKSKNSNIIIKGIQLDWFCTRNPPLVPPLKKYLA
jgi:hypothetical protein